jgi:hypothetical protein
MGQWWDIIWRGSRTEGVMLEVAFKGGDACDWSKYPTDSRLQPRACKARKTRHYLGVSKQAQQQLL